MEHRDIGDRVVIPDDDVCESGRSLTSTPEFATRWSARNVGRVLRAGVTGISVPGGKWYVDVTVREAIDGALIEGPRVFCAGRALTPYGGIFDASEAASDTTPADAVGVLCNSTDDYIRETRRQCKRGLKMIKVGNSYWGDTQTVIISPGPGGCCRS